MRKLIGKIIRWFLETEFKVNVAETLEITDKDFYKPVSNSDMRYKEVEPLIINADMQRKMRAR